MAHDPATAAAPAAEATGEQPATGHQYVLFTAGRSAFAISLRDVLEVMEPEWWVRIPHAAPWVEGLLYHHGQPLVVANAGEFLAREKTGSDGTPLVLRLNARDMKFGILVDRVVGMWRSNVPATPSRDAAFVKGVWERNGRLVNLIDLEALLERASRIFSA